MIVSITSLELRSPLKIWRLYSYTFGVIRQLRTTPCLGYKTRGWWTTHYTMSLWENEKVLQEFAKAADHRYAMRNARQIAREVRTLRIDSDQLPSWPQAIALLKAEGRVLSL